MAARTCAIALGVIGLCAAPALAEPSLDALMASYPDILAGYDQKDVFWKDGTSHRAIRAAIDGGDQSTDGEDTGTDHALPVLVVDDVVRVTAPRLRFFRELVQAGGVS